MAEETFSANSSINLIMGEKKASFPTSQLLAKWPASASPTTKFDVSTANHSPFFYIADVQSPTNATLIEDIDIFTLRFRIMDIFASNLAYSYSVYVTQNNAHIT